MGNSHHAICSISLPPELVIEQSDKFHGSEAEVTVSISSLIHAVTSRHSIFADLDCESALLDIQQQPEALRISKLL